MKDAQLQKLINATLKAGEQYSNLLKKLELEYKKRFGVLVDALVGQQQVVIKSLEEHYRKVAGIAGATIMGDGKVALIIDADSIATTYTSSQIEELLS